MSRNEKLAVFLVLVLGTLPYVLPLVKQEVFSFRDHESYFLPLRYFTSDALRAGDIPLWNPFNGSGERWLANPQTGMFYPPTWIFLFLPFPVAYTTFLLLHTFVLGIGALLLFSRHTSMNAALIGATTLMFAGPILSVLDVNNNLTTFAWVPLAIWCAITARRGKIDSEILSSRVDEKRNDVSSRASSEGSGRGPHAGTTIPNHDSQHETPTEMPRSTLGMTRGSRSHAIPNLAFVISPIVLALMFLGGEPALALLGWGVWAAAYLSSRENRSGGPWSRVGEFVRIGAVALLLISPQLVPFLESLRESDRSHGLSRAEALKQSLKPADWLSVTLPRLSRTNSIEPFRSSQKYILSLYLGVVPVLLAQLTLITSMRPSTRRHANVTVAWLTLLLLSVVLSAGKFAPILSRYWEPLHLNANRYPARVALFAVLALSGLAALGYDRFQSVSKRARWSALAATILITMTGFVLFQPMNGKSVILRISIAAFWIVAAAIASVSSPAALQTRRVAVVVSLLSAVDLWLAARPLLRTQPFRSSSELHGVISTTRKVMRFKTSPRADVTSWLDGYLNLYGKIMDTDSAGPIRPKRYLQLLESITSRPRVDIIDFLSIGYLFADGPVPSHFSPIKEMRGLRIYENRFSFPLVGLWPQYKVASSDREAFAHFLSTGSDARRSLFVTGESLVPRAQLQKRINGGTGSLRRLNHNYVEVDLFSPVRSVVTISQLDAPGWTVAVDGRPATKLKANGLFRAVMVPAGAHKIEWTYAPASLIIGLFLGLAGCCATTIDIARHRRVIDRSRDDASLARISHRPSP